MKKYTRKYAKYIEMQTKKALSAYGGIGSIIETMKGALKIEDFDEWPFIKQNINVEKIEINDKRLVKRLRFHFPKLEGLFKVPTNVAHPKIKTIPEDELSVISAEYFPKWMYCPNCERFKRLKDWWSLWEKTLEKYGEKVERGNFIKPKCYACYEEAEQKKKKTGKRQKRYYDLEQVRFIMTSPNGSIRDIPWDKWPSAQKHTKSDNGLPLPIKLDYENPCCENSDIRYKRSAKFSDLTGVSIKCNNCNQSNTLEGLFAYRRGKKEEEQFKTVIRSSNSVYYPIMITSIYLPTKEIKEKDKEPISKLANQGVDAGIISHAFSDYSLDIIKEFIKSGANEFEPEIQYRCKEYNFLIDCKEANSDDLSIKKHNALTLEKFGIKHLIELKRIKLVTVQTAYTRQEPYDKDLFLRDNDEKPLIKFKYTSKWGKNTEYLPAIESFGEGIFIALDCNAVEEWFQNKCNAQQIWKKRLEKIHGNIRENSFLSKERFSDFKYTVKFMLVHTLSHLLIKEFEFLVGYPSTSLNERLYVNKEGMQGVLIYTVAGAEGSYGGLISQAEPGQFEKVLKSALFRARDCASDPVCFHAEEQGVGGLNLAACYSCTLLPEISCEEFNCFLDRRLLIDEEFGFIDKIE
ncbi:MAG: DUF1998 domain-containing protein [Acidobacteria bacterium]|jgi:hypothetical protein|nr:DUF1998 domain-containing protein [Acidobacteriota bacterium]